MAPAYKLRYFGVHGASRFICLMFAYGEVDYDFDIIDRAEWPKIKDSTPFGQVPVLEYNGKAVNQSAAIGRYVAKLANLTGDSDWEDLEIDAMGDTISDLRHKFHPVYLESDPEKKQAVLEKCKNEFLPYYFTRFENKMGENGGFLAIPKLTWADFRLYVIIEQLLNSDPNVLDSYPNLKALYKKIGEITTVKKWLEANQ